MSDLFLGFDLSTQQLKAILLTASDDIVHESAIHFDKDLSIYGTTNGALHSTLGDGEVSAPVAMWLDALELLLTKMDKAGVDFSKIRAVGGSAQQHGSVFLTSSAKQTILNLDNKKSLTTQLYPKSFSVLNSPIWQDSSTTEECKVLQDAAGGAQKLADITGSRAYERFTGTQILKISRRTPEFYKETAYVGLISSFLSTIFLHGGAGSPNGPFPAPIEASDASGMNMMNVLTHKWDGTLLAACGAGLREKLGPEPVEGGTSLGNIGLYWRTRWGFSEDCLISPFSGDNPSTVASLIAAPGSALLSLGTSTTFLLSLPPPPTADSPPPNRTTTSHLLAHPTSKDSAIIMLCYKNGALAREEVRDMHAEKSWDKFNELIQGTEAGNGGVLGFYFPLKEIIPPNVQGNFYYDVTSKPGRKIDGIDNKREPRAILESQLLSIKSRILGIMPPNTPPLTKVLITGGSARNAVIQQLVADIFNMDVYVASEEGSKEAAALGGAFLAKWVWWRQHRAGEDRSYDAMRAEGNSRATGQILVARPHQKNVRVYGGLIDVYRECEEAIVNLLGTGK